MDEAERQHCLKVAQDYTGKKTGEEVGAIASLIAQERELARARPPEFPFSEPMPEMFIPDDVQLSNKHCRLAYLNTRCSCPENRCWYDEQKQRRAQGEKALTWEARRFTRDQEGFTMSAWVLITERLWERADGARVENSPPVPGYPNSGQVWFASEPGDPTNRIRCAYDSAEKAMADADKVWPLNTGRLVGKNAP